MTDTFVQVDPNSTGEKIRVLQNTIGGNVVDQQVVTLGDQAGNLQDTNIAAIGLTGDAAVTGDNTGSLSAKLRGLSKMLADVWNSTLHALQVQIMAATSGGYSSYPYIAAASANQDSQVVKNAAGQVYVIYVHNVNAAVRYLKLYDKSTAPTSADTPIGLYGIPGNTAGAGFGIPLPHGKVFANGIAFRLTTGIGNSDATAVTANDIALTIDYK